MRLLLTTILLAVAMYLPAKTVLPDQAKQNVIEYLKLNPTLSSLHKKSTPSADKLELAYTSRLDNVPTYYAFNSKEGGFVIAAADDVANDILVYSPLGTFDFATLPDNFKWWLSQYDEEISRAAANPSAIKYAPKKATQKKDIPYLITTGWDQSRPYNNLCPKVSTKNCITGCVATAMSQVMNYHEWPVTGTGSHSYYDLYGCKKNISTNFYEHTYDWANMTDTYEDSATVEQETAVAQLMFDAGVSVEMQYGTSGSAAYTEACPYAFANYFGYDQAVAHAYRDYFTDDEWEEMLYSELAAGRPVMYGGCSVTAGGHSFICDGYNAIDDMYHFNWGWGLSMNSYCKLSAVKGGGSTWSKYQDIIYGIQKPIKGNVAKPNIIMYDDCSLNFTTTEADGLTTYKIDFGKYFDGSFNYDGFIWNDSWAAFDVYFTMKYTNVETGKTYYAEQDSAYRECVSFASDYPVDPDIYFQGPTKLTIKNVKIPKLPVGNYNVSLAYRLWENRDVAIDSLWFDVRAFTSCKSSLPLEVKFNIDTPEPTAPTEVSDSSFTANWAPVKEAQTYMLELSSIDTLNFVFDKVITEDFSKFTASDDGTKDIGEQLDKYMNNPGWTGVKVYNSNHRMKMGSSQAGSVLTSPLIRNPKGKLIVNFKEMRYGTDPTIITVDIIDDEGKAICLSKSVAVNDDPLTGEPHKLEFNGINTDCYVKFTAPAKKRYYLSAIDIECTGPMTEKTVIDSLTTTSYSFTGLNPELLYEYKVKACNVEGESKWSSPMLVKLGSILLGDADEDGEVTVADITTIASFILGTSPLKWNFKKADVDKDGEITVADITATANIILAK